MPESEAPYTFPEDESLAIRTLITQNLETSLETLNPEEAGALTGDETVFIKVGGALKKTTLQDVADLGGGGLSDYQRVLVVDAGGNGEYTKLSDALASISGASATARYCILLFGYISESVDCIAPDYVDIIGFGAQLTFTGGKPSSHLPQTQHWQMSLFIQVFNFMVAGGILRFPLMRGLCFEIAKLRHHPLRLQAGVRRYLSVVIFRLHRFLL